MRRDSEHRVSLKRRIKRCERLLNSLFPLTHVNDIHWSHCVNLDTMTVEFQELCPMCQITSTREFRDACRKVGMSPADTVWQHSGLMRYNFEGIDHVWSRRWDRIEIEKLNAALKKLFLEKRAECPLPADAAASRIA